jgi:hypothetical protein
LKGHVKLRRKGLYQLSSNVYSYSPLDPERVIEFKLRAGRKEGPPSLISDEERKGGGRASPK